MTVIAAYLYRDGHRVWLVSIDEKTDCADSKSEFVGAIALICAMLCRRFRKLGWL